MVRQLLSNHFATPSPDSWKHCPRVSPPCFTSFPSEGIGAKPSIPPHAQSTGQKDAGRSLDRDPVAVHALTKHVAGHNVAFSPSVGVAEIALYFFGQSGFTIGGAVRFSPGSMTSKTPFCHWPISPGWFAEICLLSYQNGPKAVSNFPAAMTSRILF